MTLRASATWKWSSSALLKIHSRSPSCTLLLRTIVIIRDHPSLSMSFTSSITSFPASCVLCPPTTSKCSSNRQLRPPRRRSARVMLTFLVLCLTVVAKSMCRSPTSTWLQMLCQVLQRQRSLLLWTWRKPCLIRNLPRPALRNSTRCVAS